MNKNIEYRINQLPKEFNLPIETLNSVELHISESCTRRCSFCPHGKTNYNHSNEFMSLDTVKIIAKDLKNINFKGRLGLSGFGEPLMHPNLWNICWALHEYTDSLEIVTNGDLLTKDKIDGLYKAGVDLFTINLYDRDNSNEIESLFEGWSKDTYRIRIHPQGEGLIMNNRAGALYEARTLRRSCYLPFYKLMIDYDGSYLVCSNDWNRESQCKLNVRNTSILTFWLGEMMTKYRRNLIDKNRNLCACENCSCDGMLVGKKQFEYWRNKYENGEATSTTL